MAQKDTISSEISKPIDNMQMEEMKAHPDLFLVDRNVALCACMGDFIDLL